MMLVELYEVPLYLATIVLVYSHTQWPYIKMNRNAVVFYIGATFIQVFNFTGVYLMCMFLTPTYPHYKYIVTLLVVSRVCYAFFIHGNYMYRIKVVYFNDSAVRYTAFIAIGVFLVLQTVSVMIPFTLLWSSNSYMEYQKIKINELGMTYATVFPTVVTLLDIVYSSAADALILTKIYRSQVRPILDMRRITRFVLYNGGGLVIDMLPFFLRFSANEITAFGMLANQLVCSLMFDFLALDLPGFRTEIRTSITSLN